MKYFKGYRFKTFLSITMKFIEAVFEILIPLFMTRLIDKGISQNDTTIIYTSVMWMIGLTIMGYLCALICQYYASEISQVIGGRIRSDLLAHELKLSTDQVDAFSSSALTNRVTTDTLFIQDMIARVIRLGTRAPFLIVGTLGALMFINKKLAIILGISIPIFTIVILGFMFIAMKYHEAATNQLDRLTSKVSELLSGARIIRAFSKQEETDKIFKNENEKLYEANSRVGFFSTLSNPFTTLIMNFLLLFLIYVSGIEISLGNMTQGQTLAVINYANQLLLTLIVTMNLIMIVSRGMTSLKRVNKILEVEPRIKNHTDKEIDEAFEMEFKDVSFSFPNENRRVLKDLNFKIKNGQSLGIIGLTGSGKSTLLKLIPRFMDNTEGEILINDTPLQSYNVKSLREDIGYVPQVSKFLRGTLNENIVMGHPGNAKEALIDAQGKDILDKGLNSIIEEGGKNLSGGQRQRVSIARALNKKPKILLLDDSFSALDALTTSNLQKVLKSKYNNSAQIIVSQRTSSVSNCDWIMVLDQGEIMAEGTHQNLLESNAIYSEIHRLQSEGSDES